MNPNPKSKLSGVAKFVIMCFVIEINILEIVKISTSSFLSGVVSRDDFI